MMGFSIIFPLFPEILKFYSHQDGDFLLKFIFAMMDGMGMAQGDRYFIILFGGIIGTIYSVLQFIFSPIWGRLSDKKGRRPILLLTSGGSFLGYLIWLFSGSFSLFVLSRVITGIMGGNISVASAAMADSTDERSRAKGMGMIGAGIGLGFVFGPPISGLLSGLDLSGWWQGSFTHFSVSALFAVILAFINLMLIFFWFHESLNQQDRQLAHQSIHPILNLRFSHSGQLARICLIYFLFTFAFSGFEFCINFFLDHTFHYGPRAIGYTFVYIGVIIILIQGGVIRRISGKISEKRISLTGAISLSSGLLVLSVFSQSVTMLFVTVFFIAVGSAFLHPGLSSLTSLISQKSEQGMNIGIMRGFGALARAFSPFIFSIIYFRFSASVIFAFSGLLVLLVVFLTKGIDDSQYSEH